MLITSFFVFIIYYFLWSAFFPLKAENNLALISAGDRDWAEKRAKKKAYPLQAASTVR